MIATVPTEKKPDEVPPAAAEGEEEEEEEGAPDAQGVGGECLGARVIGASVVVRGNLTDTDGSVWGAGEGKKKKKKKKPKKKKAEQQSEPPRVGLTKLFPDGNFPEGELQDYKDECVPSHT